MIKSFKIVDNQNTFYENLKTLNLPEIHFTNGVNVLIGENGAGKSTVIDILSQYTHCHKNGYSYFSIDNLFNNPFFKCSYENIWGVEIKVDFTLSTFKMLLDSETPDHEKMNNSFNVKRMCNGQSSSMGQTIKGDISMLFELIANKKYSIFNLNPIDKILSDINEKSVSYNENLTREIAKYFVQNQTENESEIQTVLMDEPDRNLDINGLQEIFSILNNGIKNFQVITAIHNPLLISKLSKNKNINFIELTENYLKSVLDFAN